MKAKFILLLLLFSFSAFSSDFESKTPYDVCDSLTGYFSNNTDTEECPIIIRDGYFDENATGVCFAIADSLFSQIGMANKCLRFIKNKQFVQSGMVSCHKKVGGLSRIGAALKCLENSKFTTLRH